MRFSAYILVYLFILSFSNSTFPQTSTQSGTAKKEIEDISIMRNAQIKADILQEIKSLPSKYQAYYYTRLGSVYWERNQKEGIFWLTKGVELGINPATEYKNNNEKLTGLWNLLSSVLEKDALLSDKLISKIKEVKIEESNGDSFKDAHETYILIAEQILNRKKDDKLAFEFATLSLKGKNPAVNWDSSEFFGALKFKNENLANSYFAKLIEILKTNEDKNLVSNFVNYFFDSSVSNFPQKEALFNISDSQRKDLLEFLLSFIQNDSEELALKKKNHCGSIVGFGLGFLEDYKRLLPEKSLVVEQAIAVCQNAPIEPWQKPDFYKRPRKTSQDFLGLAKEISDKKIQANYLEFAAQSARGEKNYRLSTNILDSIEKQFRNFFWASAKIQSDSNLIDELFRTENFAEITELLENSPPEYRPFIIVNCFNSVWKVNQNQKEFVFDLMNQARSDFNKIDKSPVSPGDYFTNPTRFGQLTQLYVKFGFYDEAITTHAESIDALNRYADNLPAKVKEKGIVPRVSSYSRFTNSFPRRDIEFINKYFDQIYANIGKIEDTRIRISERLELLGQNLEKVPNSVLIPNFQPFK